ncbi:MAG: hypothetical protein ACTSUE_16175, partial [Promethearchaeota archaeon]
MKPITTWPIVYEFYKSHGPVHNQFSGFHAFMEESIPFKIETLPEIVYESARQYPLGDSETVNKYTVKIVGEPEITKPQFKNDDGKTTLAYPDEARVRRANYCASLYCNVEVKHYRKTFRDSETEEPDWDLINTQYYERFFFGLIPVMVRSNWCNLSGLPPQQCVDKGECEMDPGGYFIVKGREKVLVTQEGIAHNRIFRFEHDPYKFSCEIHSKIPTSTICKTYVVLETKHVEDGEFLVMTHFHHSLQKKTNHKINPVPVLFLLYALGIKTDDGAYRLMGSDPTKTTDPVTMLLYSTFRQFGEMIECLEDVYPGCDTQTKAQLWLCSKMGAKQSTRADKLLHVRYILERAFLPHIGTDPESLSEKANVIGRMAFTCIQVFLGNQKMDDRDYIGSKQFSSAGNLLYKCFSHIITTQWTGVRRTLQTMLRPKNGKPGRVRTISLDKLLKPKRLTLGLRQLVMLGTLQGKDGISQDMKRESWASSIAYLTKVNNPVTREGGGTKLRQLHGGSYGFLCPAQTPEGKAIGLVKNFAITCSISDYTDPREIRAYLDIFNAKYPTVANTRETSVYVNGKLAIKTDQAAKLIKILRGWRRKNKIPRDVSIAHMPGKHEIQINTSGGRVFRPLLVVTHPQNTTAWYTGLGNYEIQNWDGLVDDFVVEYLDAIEIETRLVAYSPEDVLSKRESNFTHCEIHPCMMLGLCASMIPFPNCNQSPRVLFQCAMGQQATGVYAQSFQRRVDKIKIVLWYPQKPLMDTEMSKIMGTQNVPAGIVPIVAILSAGYNQEDSIIVNKRYVDLGGCRAFLFRGFECAEHPESVKMSNNK